MACFLFKGAGRRFESSSGGGVTGRQPSSAEASHNLRMVDRAAEGLLHWIIVVKGMKVDECLAPRLVCFRTNVLIGALSRDSKAVHKMRNGII